MEQKAKRIGKFNIIDVIAIVLILAALAFVGWKLLGPDDTAGAPRNMTKVTYVVKVEGVPAELYEKFLANDEALAIQYGSELSLFKRGHFVAEPRKEQRR